MTSKLLPAFGLMVILAAPAATASTAAGTGCASLCGEWRLDPAASDTPQRALDTAFLKFKDPRPRRMRAPSGEDSLGELGQAADEEILGPMVDRPRHKELREELETMLQQPQQLRVDGRNDDVLISADGQAAQSLTPGEPHVRVDRYGTAKISVRWHGPSLSISEKYDRRNQQEMTYALHNVDGSLQVQQVISRPGLPRITVRSVYRRL